MRQAACNRIEKENRIPMPGPTPLAQTRCPLPKLLLSAVLFVATAAITPIALAQKMVRIDRPPGPHARRLLWGW